MKTKSITVVLLMVVIAAVAVFVYRDALAKNTPSFRTVTIEKGNMQSKVSATGTLGAVTTVAKSAYEQSQSSMQVARAQLRSAQVAMDRAKQNRPAGLGQSVAFTSTE